MSDLKFFLGKMVINKQAYTFLPSFHIMLILHCYRKTAGGNISAAGSLCQTLMSPGASSPGIGAMKSTKLKMKTQVSTVFSSNSFL